ncbi:MAG: carbohydrate ABC transporter permease [Treponema sp.]|jgi:putative aldouronate transport system permease protein|nr:carbohydrate ABC transporter permease [Treponema sp.]
MKYFLRKKRKHDAVDFIIFLFMCMVIVVTLYPFLNVLAKSFNDPIDTVKGGVHIFPRVFTTENYASLFSNGSNLPSAFRMSILRTLVGTVLGALCCSMFAFALSRKDFIFRKPFTALLAVTMYVGGGMIPEYILIRNLGLINSFWVYVIPGLISAFNVIVIRAFIDNIPSSLQESARIDGANDAVIFFRIILPLCAPVLATVSLFIAVGQWNSWFDTYLYARNDRALSTLQYELMKVLDSAQSVNSASAVYSEGLRSAKRNPEAIKMAITVIATTPILVVYPFLQKYFVSGITLGAVKG